MTSCTIIISHYESVAFLIAAIRSIRKHKHPEIEQRIYICDQSGDYTFKTISDLYAKDEDIWVVHTKPLWSGYGIDFLLHNNFIKTDYICQIHSDVVTISNQWLYLPIKLIEENNFSFVGQLQFISDGSQSIYPPHPIFAMAQCFNVAKTETYREMSLEAGFTRFHNRPDCGLTFKNNDWAEWAKEDYQARGSDDDIVAFHWNSKYKTENMLGLAITGYIESGYGRLIEDLVFHFGSANEARGVMSSMPELYQEYTKRINENYDDDLIEEMVSLAKANKPPELEILTRNLWDGELKISSPTTEQLNNRIEELKNE